MENFLQLLKEYWFIITPLTSVVVAYLVKTEKRIKAMEKLASTSDERGRGLKALLTLNEKQTTMILNSARATLLSLLTKEIKKGVTTLYTKETIARMVESYVDMGGNSFITDLYEEYKQIPVELNGGQYESSRKINKHE